MVFNGDFLEGPPLIIPDDDGEDGDPTELPASATVDETALLESLDGRVPTGIEGSDAASTLFIIEALANADWRPVGTPPEPPIA